MFLVEGNKTIKELEGSKFKIREIYSVAPESLDFHDQILYPISEAELSKLSFLKHPKDSVAICELYPQKLLSGVQKRIVLDGIQDPGNMGTIIRLADWFGIEEIVCSPDTVDFYNPKVLMSSMGSFTRVNIVYTELPEFLTEQNHVNFIADMEGDDLYKIQFPDRFNLILGNEGNGIRDTTRMVTSRKITIPRFGKSQKTESLNVAMATAVILGQIFRN